MKFESITNPEARAFVELIDKVRTDWEQRRKARDLNGIILTVAKAYPADTHAIISIFERKPAKVGPKRLSRDATPPALGSAVDVAKCDSCPENMSNGVGVGRGTVIEPDTTHLQTKEGVLEAFDNDVELLTTVAKGLSINIANSGKAGTIAGKIAYHYRVKAGVQ